MWRSCLFVGVAREVSDVVVKLTLISAYAQAVQVHVEPTVDVVLPATRVVLPCNFTAENNESETNIVWFCKDRNNEQVIQCQSNGYVLKGHRYSDTVSVVPGTCSLVINDPGVGYTATYSVTVFAYGESYAQGWTKLTVRPPQETAESPDSVPLSHPSQVQTTVNSNDVASNTAGDHVDSSAVYGGLVVVFIVSMICLIVTIIVLKKRRMRKQKHGCDAMPDQSDSAHQESLCWDIEGRKKIDETWESNQRADSPLQTNSGNGNRA